MKEQRWLRMEKINTDYKRRTLKKLGLAFQDEETVTDQPRSQGKALGTRLRYGSLL